VSIPRDLSFGSFAPQEPEQGSPPEYPSPWATTQPREGLRDNGTARIVSLFPDICLTPRGKVMVPVPYNIHDIVEHDENFTPSVKFTGEKAMVFRSRTSHVHGNEQGTGGGIKSGTTPGECEPIGHASQLNAEGSPVIRHQDRFFMNNRNTIGEARFVKDTKTYKAPEDTDPVPGSIIRASFSQTMTDAAPEPMIPGRLYAQAQPAPQFPQQAPQMPSGGSQGAPYKGPVGPAANDNTYQRRGTYGNPGAGMSGAAGRLASLLGLAQAAQEAGNIAGRWYVGADGVAGKSIGETLSKQVTPFSPQGYEIGSHVGFPSIGRDANVNYANDLLSLKTGELKDFRTMSPEELEDVINRPWPSAEQLKKNSQTVKEARKKRQALPQAQTGARVDNKPKKACIVGPYNKIKNLCGPGRQAHHIVPDYTLRYGNRAEGERGINRIPGMPSFGDGPAICLEGHAGMADTEHYEAHMADALIAALGVQTGTARIEDIKDIAVAAVINIKSDCAPEILTLTEATFATVDENQLARTTKSLPSGEALRALKTGMKAQ
jgi:hypothetical protein